MAEGREGWGGNKKLTVIMYLLWLKHRDRCFTSRITPNLFFPTLSGDWSPAPRKGGLRVKEFVQGLPLARSCQIQDLGVLGLHCPHASQDSTQTPSTFTSKLTDRLQAADTENSRATGGLALFKSQQFAYEIKMQKISYIQINCELGGLG